MRESRCQRNNWPAIPIGPREKQGCYGAVLPDAEKPAAVHTLSVKVLALKVKERVRAKALRLWPLLCPPQCPLAQPERQTVLPTIGGELGSICRRSMRRMRYG